MWLCSNCHRILSSSSSSTEILSASEWSEIYKGVKCQNKCGFAIYGSQVLFVKKNHLKNEINLPKWLCLVCYNNEKHQSNVLAKLAKDGVFDEDPRWNKLLNKKNVNSIDEESGVSLFMFACYYGKFAIASQLLSEKFNADVSYSRKKDNVGNDVLYWVAQGMNDDVNKKIKMIKLIKSKGGVFEEVDCKCSNYNGRHNREMKFKCNIKGDPATHYLCSYCYRGCGV